VNGFISKAIRPLALGCAAAAVLVGGAQAAHPDDRAGSHGAASVGVAPDLVERAVARLQAQGVSAPDLIERALLRQTAATPRPDDRAGVRTISPIEPGQLAVVSTGADSGFHWNEAGIGAGTALILVFGAGLMLAQFRRHRPVLR
jgi:hypothetical protein